ncbi:hypothetical protein D3C84_1305950 [compost metagenome]
MGIDSAIGSFSERYSPEHIVKPDRFGFGASGFLSHISRDRTPFHETEKKMT